MWFYQFLEYCCQPRHWFFRVWNGNSPPRTGWPIPQACAANAVWGAMGTGGVSGVGGVWGALIKGHYWTSEWPGQWMWTGHTPCYASCILLHSSPPQRGSVVFSEVSRCLRRRVTMRVGRGAPRSTVAPLPGWHTGQRRMWCPWIHAPCC